MSAIELYAKSLPGFEHRVQEALDLLQTAAAYYPAQVVQATSLGAEDMVITDLIARHHLPIAIASLNTGKLHAQTLLLIERTTKRYQRPIEVYQPATESVVHFVQTQGEDAMFRSVALRKACCHLRKVEPLERMLAGAKAWIVGLRREQSLERQEVALEVLDTQGRIKLSPLANWSWADVWHYIDLHLVPYNPLHDQFMPSIGCEPCTRAIAVGEPFRAGRWWWEDEQSKECGLHAQESTAMPLEI